MSIPDTQTTAEVVTLGECLISLIARDRGPLAESETFVRTVAGAEANVAVGLARLGHRVAYVGRVGGDAFGAVIRRRLRGEGVDTRHLATDTRGATGLMVRELAVTLDPWRSSITEAARRVRDSSRPTSMLRAWPSRLRAGST